MSDLIRFPESTSIALHALTYLAMHHDRPGRLISQNEIASTFGVSEAHLAKVMQQLRKCGYVESTRGPTGGFILTCNPHETSLLEIHEVLQGSQAPKSCILQHQACDGESCPLGKVVKKLDEQLINFLKSTTIAAVSQHLDKKSFNISPSKRELEKGE